MIDRIYNYKILSKIGEGGMGVVYLGEHLSLRRKVAIKALHQNFTDNLLIRQRFINEGITLSNLNHPNIVILYDFIEEENRIYLIMEYVEGFTLDKIMEMKNEPFKEEQIIPIFKTILNAFDYAHKKGIIHRDIKPSNIMLNRELEPKILDFGIAKILGSNIKITTPGIRMGSVIYMSPEQVLGKAVDLRSDIYSLGITLFEILTKRLPYDVTTNSEYEIQTKIVKENLKPISLYNPRISQRIDYIIQKATAKDPNSRFQTCSEFAKALEDKNYQYNHQKIQRTISQEVPKPSKISNPSTGGTSSSLNKAPYHFNRALMQKKKETKKNIRNYFLIIITSGVIITIIIIIIITFFIGINKKNNDIVKKEDKVNKEKTNPKFEKINLQGYYQGYADRFGYDPMEMWITKDSNGILYGSSLIKFSNGTKGKSDFEGIYKYNTGEIFLNELEQTKGAGTIKGKVDFDNNYIFIDAVFTRRSDGGKYNWHLKKEK